MQVLPHYLPNFIKAGHADVRQIKHFNEKMLMDIGIDNVVHRQLILDTAFDFKREAKRLTRKFEKNQILREFHQCFRDHAILTMSQLRKDVRTIQDVSKIINVPANDSRCLKILDIIHPSGDKLKRQMSQVQEKFKKASEKLDSFYEGISAMQTTINTVNTLSSDQCMKEQQNLNKLIHDYDSLLSKHSRLAEKLGQNQVCYILYLVI